MRALGVDDQAACRKQLQQGQMNGVVLLLIQKEGGARL